MAKSYRTEADIEAAGERRLKKLGCKTRKMNGQGFRSWPDRQVIPIQRVPRVRSSFWIEWKRPRERLTPQQQLLHRQLIEDHDQLVYVCREPDDAIKAFEHWERGDLFDNWKDELK